MKHRVVILAASLLALSLTALAFAAQSKDEPAAAPSVTGTWKCLAHGVVHEGQPGDTPFTLELRQDGENVTGSVTSPLGDADVSSGTFKDGKLQIEIDTENAPYILTAALEDGQLKGDWAHGQAKGAWEGNKSATSTPTSSQPQ